VLHLLSGFVEELRRAGLPVSLTEHLDAAEAIHHVPIEDREALKYALGATMVKSASHWHAFETAFNIYFAPGLGSGEPGTGPADGSALAQARALPGERQGQQGGGAMDQMTPEELAALLYQALLQGDQSLMRVIARQAVTRFAGIEPGRPVGGTYYLYRTLRNLDLDGVLARLVGQAKRDRQEQGDGELSPLDERLLGDEYRGRIDQLKKAVEDEIRRRLVEDRGAEALARSIRKPLPEDLDVMHATRDELATLQRALQPLSRKLAVRLARRRRHRRRGPLDFRATVRRSLSTGGVPVEPRFRHPRPAKPEIVVVADISGSVASFARFTLHLVYAIQSQFSKVRSFVFVDGIDEVTRFFERADDPAEAVQKINTEADVVWVDGHSDYGHALGVFYDRYGDEITNRTSVLVLGDARNNYHAPEDWVLAELRKKARHLYWLNPEPRDYWGSGDSIISEYGRHCDAVVECRTLRQLERFVGDLD
jgi:uncharacterized protein with von Willebrand factor type A (vWA) domain